MIIHKKEIIVKQDVIERWQIFLDLIADKLNVPVALIMKVSSSDIEVFLTNRSKANPYKVGESSRLFDSGLYCERVCKTQKELLIPDAVKDKEWNKNPDIKLGMISYLGFPILWPDGEIFGTTCILDVKENGYSAKHRDIVLCFKKYIEAYLDLVISRHLKRDEKEIKEKDFYCEDVFSKVEKMLNSK